MLLGEKTVHAVDVATDRRLKARIKEQFPASVSGTALDGERFSGACVVDNMSAGGLYLRGPHELGVNSEIEVIVHLFVEGETGSTVEATGKVVRVEKLHDGSHGSAITISRHRFL